MLGGQIGLQDTELYRGPVEERPRRRYQYDLFGVRVLRYGLCLSRQHLIEKELRSPPGKTGQQSDPPADYEKTTNADGSVTTATGHWERWLTRSTALPTYHFGS